MATRFGPYRLLRRIAAGGMGEVYLAVLEREGGFEKTVALKTMLPTVQKQKSFAELFESEATVAAMLNHANIVHIFDHGVIQGKSYLTMELVEGPDLGSLITAVGARGFPPGVAVEIGIQLCRGLSHAHERSDLKGRPAGIVHGDVSPANILISLDGQVKLADFGLARVRQVLSDQATVTGKYPYMSPEQAEGKPLGPQSDLFSLGLVLYEMLTGSRAFEPKDSPEATLSAIRAHRLTPAQKKNPGLSDPLLSFLDRTLSADVKTRFQTAREMASALAQACSPAGPEALGDFVRHNFQGSHAPARATPEPTEVAQKPVSPSAPTGNRRPLLALAALLVTAWGAGFAWWAFSSPPDKPPPPARPGASSQASLRLTPARAGPLEEPAKPAARPSPAPPLLVIAIPEGFQALVDHQKVPGRRIALRKKRPHLVRLKPRQGKTPEINLRLSPSGLPDGSWQAAVRATPWMKVSLDKRPVGQTPRSRLVLPAGRSHLNLARAGHSIGLVLDLRKPKP